MVLELPIRFQAECLCPEGDICIVTICPKVSDEPHALKDEGWDNVGDTATHFLHGATLASL